ncbi:MAG: spore coat protein U domain-containing protein [Pseudomonadota bacterium]
MRNVFSSWSLVLLLMLSSANVFGAINCSVSSAGINTAYTGALSINQTTLDITCTRLSGDPATSAYSVSADNGINAVGQVNRASLGGNYLSYQEFQDSICGTNWQPGSDIAGSINFGSALAVSVTVDYWACLPAGQVYAVGSYNDTVLMTLTYNDGIGDVTTTGGHQVTIITSPSCSISTAPGVIAFSYTALQNSATSTSTTFGTTCSIDTSYSISVDTADGVISGLQYSLRLNTADTGGSNPLGSSGTGVEQNFYINGTMPASQAGSCTSANCQDSVVHTLLITY